MTGTFKAILYILFSLFLIVLAQGRLKLMVHPKNVSMNILSYSLYKLIIFSLFLIMINTFQMMVFNLVKENPNFDIEPSREDSREVLVNSLMQMVTSCSLCWIQGLQCFEWLSIALVINNEKKLKTKQVIAKYHSQYQIRHKFNLKERKVSFMFFIPAGCLTIAYFAYKTFLVFKDFSLHEIHLRNPKNDYVVMKEIMDRSLPLPWEIGIVTSIMAVQLVLLFLMLRLMAKYQKEAYDRFKAELVCYGIFVFLISISQIAKYLIRQQLVNKYKQYMEDGRDPSEEPSNDLMLTFQILDFKFGFSSMVNFMLILKMKKCEDYIAACSILKTLTIVSIH